MFEPQQIIQQAPVITPLPTELPSPGIEGLPIELYLPFADTVNNAIEEFKKAGGSEAKIVAIQKIEKALRDVDMYANPNHLAADKKFHELKSNLFTQVKNAYAQNGVHNLFRPQSAEADSQIADIIANMAPDKADQLMEILDPGTKDSMAEVQEELKLLYDGEVSPEADRWKNFLASNSIEFLGGANSKNFKIINFNGSKVLKIDNRMGMPRSIEHHLREALGDVFTPVDAERQVRIAQDSGWGGTSRVLLVTDVCPAGSVLEHGKMAIDDNEMAPYKRTCDIMGQMTQVFMNIQEANCCFPDSKLSNWLVDNNGKIRLADTKSFIFTENGEYRKTIPGNKYFDINYTPGFETMEMLDDSFNAEKLHSAILGRNIYTYLTGDWPKEDEEEVDMIGQKKPPKLSRMEQQIFQSPIGQEYKKLINDLIKDPAASRMSLSAAQAKLQELEIKLAIIENRDEENDNDLELEDNAVVQEIGGPNIKKQHPVELMERPQQVKFLKDLKKEGNDKIVPSLIIEAPREYLAETRWKDGYAVLRNLNEQGEQLHDKDLKEELHAFIGDQKKKLDDSLSLKKWEIALDNDIPHGCIRQSKSKHEMYERYQQSHDQTHALLKNGKKLCKEVEKELILFCTNKVQQIEQEHREKKKIVNVVDKIETACNEYIKWYDSGFHINHGKKGRANAQELLTKVSNPNTSFIEIFESTQEAINDSKDKNHSFSRYLYEALGIDARKMVGIKLEENTKNDYKEQANEKLIKLGEEEIAQEDPRYRMK